MQTYSSTPLISIITAVLNDRHGLTQTKISIEKQLFHDFEWIVIDGSSTDGTGIGDVATEGMAVAFFSQLDSGVYSAMNIGLEKARGQYLLFLNAGDTFTSESSLAHLAPLLISGEFDLLYGNSIQWQRDGKFHKVSNGHENIAYGMFACHQAMYFKKASVGTLKYDERYKISADYDFTARFLKLHNRVEYVNDFLCICTPPGLSSKFKATGLRENWTIQKQTIGVGLPRRLLALASSSGMQFLSLLWPRGYSWVQQSAVKNKVIRLISSVFRSAPP